MTYTDDHRNVTPSVTTKAFRRRIEMRIDTPSGANGSRTNTALFDSLNVEEILRLAEITAKQIPGPRDTDLDASRAFEGSADQNSCRGAQPIPGQAGHGLHAEGEPRRRERPRGLLELPRDRAIELERRRRHNAHYDRARLSPSGRHRTYSSPQVLSALSTGTSAFPFLVSRYSARGGCSE
jgi:hypothetical protein